MMRAALQLLVRQADRLAGAVIDRAGDVVREQLDGYAFAWLMTREGLDRQRAGELLERLGAELGAKIELSAPP